MSEKVKARATIHLPGLVVGATALVDPNRPYIAEVLERGFLVREDEPLPEQPVETAQ